MAGQKRGGDGGGIIPFVEPAGSENQAAGEEKKADAKSE